MLRRAIIVLIAVLSGGGLFTLAQAQQKTPPDVTRDTDRDGVPDTRDRCPGTAAGIRVDVNGCAVVTPAPVTPPPSAAPAPAASAPAPAGAGGVRVAIAQQAAQPSASQPGAAKPGAPAAVTSPTQTGGAPPGASAPSVTPTGAQPAAPRPAGPQPTAAPAGAAAAPGGAPPAAVPPVAAASSARPAVTGALPNATVTPGAAAPAGAKPTAAAASGAPAAPSGAAAPAANQPARSAPAASAATVDNTLTEGFMMRVWVPNSGRPTLEYLRDYALRLDSATLMLRNIFSTASGQPVAGASDPTKLVTREKLRWRRCRNIKEDFQTFADNISLLQDSLPANMREWWTTLGDRFDSLQGVLENCETIAFMIESPERYAPWQSNYENSARAFYGEWYAKLRAMHEALRQVARLVAAQLPVTADRRQALQMIPPLPTLAPTPGAH